MAFRVEYTAKAEQDLEAILEWLIARNAGEAGARWFRKLQEEVASLSTLPYRCPLAPESREVPFEVRQLLYGRTPHQYRILFTVEGGMVIIVHIRHGRGRHIGEFQ